MFALCQTYVDGGPLGIDREPAWFTQSSLVSASVQLSTYRGWQSNTSWTLVNGEFLLPSAKWFSSDARLLNESDIELKVRCEARCWA